MGLAVAAQVMLFSAGQGGNEGLNNEEMLARLQQVGGDLDDEEVSAEEWTLKRLKNAQSARDLEQKYENLRLEREEQARQQAAKQQLEEGNSLETRNLFQALMKATDDDYVELENLLRSGVDANRVNRNGDTPLHTACVRGQGVVVQLLLTAGANPNARANQAISSQDMTPLAWCVHAGHFDATEAVLDSAKTDVNMHFVVKQLGPQPLTALDLAIRRGDEDLLALLLEHKAKTYEDLNKPADNTFVKEDTVDDEVAFQRFLNLEG